MSKLRHLFAAVALVAGVSALAAQDSRKDSAKDSTKDTSVNGQAAVESSAVRQAQLKRSFEQFRAKLAVLTGRLETSQSTKDQEKAKAMRAALKEASERATENKFDSLIRALNTRGADQNLDVLNQAIRENRELRDDLKKMIALLTQDDRDKVLKERREEALRLLETLKDLRDKQARAQTQTELGRKDSKELGKDQKKITDQTKDLRDKLDKPTKDTEIAKQMEAVKKPVGDANKEQKDAEGKLGKNDKEGAGESQGNAVTKLNQAIKELEDLINQTRQEEKERKLRDLLARAKKMLENEQAILGGTETLSRELSKQKDRKADVTQAARSTKLAEKQLEGLRDCEAALNLIKEDGTAVAFHEIFQQIDTDMDTAQRRLNRIEVDTVTVVIVNDVVEALKEVVRALEKAIKENENPPPPGPSGPSNPNDKLVSLLQQLKMIHAMQTRVNNRTAMYAKHYSGEQVPQANNDREKERYEGIAKELKDLSGRQERLSKVTKDLGKQAQQQQ
jgi:hypothetical protein